MLEHAFSRRSALATTGVSLAAALLPRSAAAQTPATVRIATTLAESFAEPIFADELGFYKKAGLTVEITRYAGGEPSEAAVVSGNADIGITTPIQLANAVSHDLPLRLIGWCGQYSKPQPALYTAKDSPLRTARDLIGKTIGVNALGTMNFLGVATWLTKNGVDVKQVRAIEVPFAAIPAALERGTIDAGVIAEPFITMHAADMRMLAPAFEVMGPHWSICVWFSRIDFIKAQPALIKRCMDVAYDTAKYVNAHPEATNPIIAKYAKIAPETVAAMMHTQFAEGPAPDTVRIQLEAAYRFKLLPRPLTVTDLTSTR
jgi:NitT/TauT family transport system substrate-binding protein